MMKTKKYILLLCCFLLTALNANTQSIKEKEQARIKKAQLSLNDLLQLLQSKDLDYVDRYLTGRGWELHSTNIKEKNDNRYSYDDDDEEEVLADYKTVTWSFDKNSYNGLAKGWFYFYLYPTYDNAISYAIADDEQLNRLKSELTNNGYERIYPTDAIVRGLESVYRNSMYEVNFQKRLKKRYEEGADISYGFFIYNYKQVEERKAEAARLAREASEQEEKYQNAIQRAESAYHQEQYAAAKQLYNEALAIKPENREQFSDILAEIDKKIADFQLFLTERTYKRYDYKMFERDDYNAKGNYIGDELRNALLAKGESLKQTTVSIICEVDSFGVSTANFNTSVQDKNLNATLEKVCKNLKLKQVFTNGYTTLAKAEFNYTLDYNHAVVTVKKNAKYISSLDLELMRAPYGKYTFDMNKITINGQEYNNNKIVKMSGSGGPSNALLSLLVPGLGVHRVTFGEKSGVSTALWTYGFIGAGVGLKFYSNNEYAKYHAATEQSAMDKHYKRANFANQGFYACVGIGAIIWVYDVIWVCAKGVQNKKEQKAWKRSNMSFYYTPDVNAAGLTYAINF